MNAHIKITRTILLLFVLNMSYLKKCANLYTFNKNSRIIKSMQERI